MSRSFFKRLTTYSSFVKLEHTVFSLPLIYAGAWLGGPLTPGLALLILVAAIGGRVTAMGLNRLIDAKIDRRNPRTRGRELPRGAMETWEGWLVVIVAGGVYLTAASAISRLCLWLSPVPVALFAIYPYLKRFTSLAHFGLGLAWSMAPAGGWFATFSTFPSREAILDALERQGWAALGSEFAAEAGLLWMFSVFWVTGFDIIYATMDEAFDREWGLHSIPVALGKTGALRLSRLLHALAFLSLAVLWAWQLGGSLWAFPWLVATGLALAVEQAAADRNPEFAFFKVNAVIGFLVLGLVIFGR